MKASTWCFILQESVSFPPKPTSLAFVCHRYIGKETSARSTIDAGAAANMHLAAILALRQLSPPSVRDSSYTNPGGIDLLSSAFKPAFNRGTSGGAAALAFPQSAASNHEAAADLSTPHDKLLVVRAVEGATRASVVATELSNAPVVELVARLLDAEATQTREATLVGAIYVDAKKRESQNRPACLNPPRRAGLS